MSASVAAEHADHPPAHGHENDHGHAPPSDQYGTATNGKIAMWLFLVSDAFSFGGLLIAYGILRSGSHTWHHKAGELGWKYATEPKLGINFTAGLTFLLICSSVSMVMAYAAAADKDRKGTLLWLGLTILGGLLFLTGQYHEYFGIWSPGLTKEGLTFGHSAYASTFYLITSFHGLHVATGTLYLIITWIRTARGKTNENVIEIVGLFWHFVDLVWILVFTFIYLL